MLIRVANDIINCVIETACANHEAALHTFRELLMAAKRHKHVVFFPGLTEQQIGHLSAMLTKAENRVLSYIHSRRFEVNNLCPLLEQSICVTYQIPDAPEANVIYLNPQSQRDVEFYEETHLITENLSDAEFYSTIVGCNFVTRKHVPEKLKKMSFYPTQGGGSTIADVVAKEQDLSQHLCLIISDSDKKYDGAPEGGTPTGIREKIKEFDKTHSSYIPFQKLYVLSHVREIENLIPLNVLSLVSGRPQKAFLTAYASFMSYYDIKDGLDYRGLHDSLTYHYWEAIFGKLPVWNQVKQYKREHRSYEKYKDAVKDLPPLDGKWGGSILKSIMYPSYKKEKAAYIKLKNTNFDMLTDSQKQEWEQIGRLVYSWGCCYSGL